MTVTSDDEGRYLILSHHDEYYTNGYTHLITIKGSGTAMEIMDQTPTQPYRARNRSGLSDVVLTFEQFDSWFDWFVESHLYNESFKLQIESKSDPLIDLLEDMDVEYHIET